MEMIYREKGEEYAVTLNFKQKKHHGREGLNKQKGQRLLSR